MSNAHIRPGPLKAPRSCDTRLRPNRGATVYPNVETPVAEAPPVPIITVGYVHKLKIWLLVVPAIHLDPNLKIPNLKILLTSQLT